MSIWLTILAVALGAASPMNAPAQDSLSLTPIQATTHPSPPFPARERRRGREGWVLVEVTVSDRGIVEDARVVDSSGSEAFDKVTLNTIQKWRYDPAPNKTKSRVLVNFEFRRTHPALRSRFFGLYKSAHEAIDNGDLAKAQNLVDKMRHEDKLTVFELAYTNIAAGRVAAERGDRAEQLRCFRRAMLNGGRWLDDRTYRYLLYATVVLEIQEEDFASALRDYALLTETAVGREIATDLDEPIHLVQSIVDGDDSITPPFMVADMEITVKRERCDSRVYASRPWDRYASGNDIAEREYQRMKGSRKQD